MTVVWKRWATGLWIGLANKHAYATITRATKEREPNRKRHRWRVSILVHGTASTWAILGSVPSAKRYAEKFIDRHTG